MGSLFDGKYIQRGNRFLPITEVYLKSSQKYTVKLFCKNSQRLKAVNYFRRKRDRRFGLGSKYASVLSPC